MKNNNPKRIITYLQPAALPGTEIWTARSDDKYWRVFHDRYVLCTTTAAAATWKYRGKTHTLTDRTHMLLEPGETHVNTLVHKPADHRVLFFSPSMMHEAARELGQTRMPHFRVAQVADDPLFAAIERFYAAVDNHETDLELQSRLAACTHLILDHHTEEALPKLQTANAHRAVVCAKAYLQEHFDKNVCLDVLSAVTNLSRFHLLRIFTRHVGLPPHAYQIRLRIARAATLLRAGIPTSKVGSVVGFADQSHFIRHFKQVMSITPGVYAAAIGAASRVFCL
ncbi:MAG: helix-turn-helix transcriptional regulator [Acidiferrobacterales bacterium]